MKETDHADVCLLFVRLSTSSVWVKDTKVRVENELTGELEAETVTEETVCKCTLHVLQAIKQHVCGCA